MCKLNILKGERAKRGLIQKEMAENIGISHMTYFRKENGLRDFNVDEVKKIADFLNLNLDQVNEIFFANSITKCNIKGQ